MHNWFKICPCHPYKFVGILIHWFKEFVKQVHRSALVEMNYSLLSTLLYLHLHSPVGTNHFSWYKSLLLISQQVLKTICCMSTKPRTTQAMNPRCWTHTCIVPEETIFLSQKRGGASCNFGYRKLGLLCLFPAAKNTHPPQFHALTESC